MNEQIGTLKESELNKRTGILFAILTALVLGCTPPPDEFGKLDLKKWRSDRGGCNGIRATLESNFKAEIQNLKGKTANTLGEMLGRPDVNQIADRNQKYYIYFLEKGPQCDMAGKQSNSRSVAIRMSAMGVATEITFQNGIP